MLAFVEQLCPDLARRLVDEAVVVERGQDLGGLPGVECSRGARAVVARTNRWSTLTVVSRSGHTERGTRGRDADDGDESGERCRQGFSSSSGAFGIAMPSSPESFFWTSMTTSAL